MRATSFTHVINDEAEIAIMSATSKLWWINLDLDYNILYMCKDEAS